MKCNLSYRTLRANVVQRTKVIPLSCLLLGLMLPSVCFAQTGSLVVGPETVTNGTSVYQATTTITNSSTFVVEGSANVTFMAAGSITLTPGFHAIAGSGNPTFEAVINPSVVTTGITSTSPSTLTISPNPILTTGGTTGSATIYYTAPTSLPGIAIYVNGSAICSPPLGSGSCTATSIADGTIFYLENSTTSAVLASAVASVIVGTGSCSH